MDERLSDHVSFTRAKLGDLTDNSGTLIFDHALRVCALLRERLERFGHRIGEAEYAMLGAALFHDLLEDTDATEAEIEAVAGTATLVYVRELTLSFRKRSLAEAVRPLESISEEGFLIKLADIYDNCSKSRFLVRESGESFYRGFYLPLMREYLALTARRADTAVRYSEPFRSFVADIEVAYRRLEEMVNRIFPAVPGKLEYVA
jgi:(p)ppGpp synthase/HD superfamily hydrolase